jgi:hypothetical protein
LLELVLALALAVLATSIIAYLVEMYSSNFATRGEDIRREALARSILNMIADDLRSTVVKQEFDPSVLEQLLMGQVGGQSGSGSGAGGGQAGGGASSGGQTGGGAVSGGNSGGQGANPNTLSANSSQSRGGAGATTSSAGSGQTGQSSRGGMSGAAGGSSTTVNSGSAAGNAANAGAADASGDMGQSVVALPLGLVGSASQLNLDVSRLPRPDEYIAQQASIASGQLTDVPGDIKSVSYYVQVPSSTGVSDVLDSVTSAPNSAGMVGGLVRRQLDRAIISTAEELGQTDQLMRTGDLIAPEVVSLEFAYFDGVQWLTSWDSSSQGMPWLVEISLAMQSKSGEQQGLIEPGISLSTMPYEEQSLYGIQVYTLTVAIPGAQLQAQSAQSADMAAGMEAVGL